VADIFWRLVDTRCIQLAKWVSTKASVKDGWLLSGQRERDVFDESNLACNGLARPLHLKFGLFKNSFSLLPWTFIVGTILWSAAPWIGTASQLLHIDLSLTSMTPKVESTVVMTIEFRSWSVLSP
jgi:hypothetical protein